MVIANKKLPIRGDVSGVQELTAVTGTFTKGLTVSGTPVDIGVGGLLVTASGFLQNQIDAVEASDVDAVTVSGGSDITGTIDLVGANGVNVSNSGNTITFDGSSLQNQIDNIDIDVVDSINNQTGDITITGTANVNVITVGNTITISGVPGARAVFEQPTAFSELTFNHGLNTLYPIVGIWDFDGTCLDIGADSICASGVNHTTIVQDPAASGIYVFDRPVGEKGDTGDQGLPPAIIGIGRITATSGTPGTVTISGSDDQSIQILDPDERDYVLDARAYEAYSVNRVNIKATAGTTFASITIQGVEVEGLDNMSVTTTLTEFVATSANSVSSGDEVLLTLSGVATSGTDVRASILYGDQ